MILGLYLVDCPIQLICTWIFHDKAKRTQQGYLLGCIPTCVCIKANKKHKLEQIFSQRWLYSGIILGLEPHVCLSVMAECQGSCQPQVTPGILCWSSLSCHLKSEKKPAEYFPVFWNLCAHIFTATVSIADIWGKLQFVVLPFAPCPPRTH